MWPGFAAFRRYSMRVSSLDPHSARRAYLDQPGNFDGIRQYAEALDASPERADATMRGEIALLLRDGRLNPSSLSAAGWAIALPEYRTYASGAELHGDLKPLVERLDADDLALALLNEDLVTNPGAEAVLTKVRRWLLIEGQWSNFPRLTAALARQASLNGGAWWVEEDELERLSASNSSPLASCYQLDADREDPAIRDGAGHVPRQYERWPYPFWRRITQVAQTSLAETVRTIEPVFPVDIPDRPAILVAGCGTGREPAKAAMRFPGATIVALDISSASLFEAQERCAALGLSNLRFLQGDLRAAGGLGQEFDAIFCSGVLHHLADPETGWAALAGVLKPGGVMRVMVYSKTARLLVNAAKAMVADLHTRPMTASALRQARRRGLLNLASAPFRVISGSSDFYYLAGVHDLLFNVHEDPFDVERIRRTLCALDLHLLRFDSGSSHFTQAYQAECPWDEQQRDLDGLKQFERRHPTEFLRMYRIWVQKSVAAGQASA